MGLVPFMKRDTKEFASSLSFSFHMCVWRKGHVGTQQEAALYKPGRGTSPRTKSAGTFILDFPASRTVRNKCLLFKPPNLRHLLQQPEQRQQKLSYARYRSCRHLQVKFIPHALGKSSVSSELFILTKSLAQWYGQPKTPGRLKEVFLWSGKRQGCP